MRLRLLFIGEHSSLMRLHRLGKSIGVAAINWTVIDECGRHNLGEVDRNDDLGFENS
jgi:hypothetical protein